MKWIKRIALAAGVVVLLVIVAVVIITVTFDPNQYKGRITAEVKKATGRELTLGGDIVLSFFPWLGIRLEALSFSNAPGFGDDPFAQLEAADVHVAVLPLLRGEVQVDRVHLKGLVLNLKRNKAGRPHGPADRAGTRSPRGTERRRPAGANDRRCRHQ